MTCARYDECRPKECSPASSTLTFYLQNHFRRVLRRGERQEGGRWNQVVSADWTILRLVHNQAILAIAQPEETATTKHALDRKEAATRAVNEELEKIMDMMRHLSPEQVVLDTLEDMQLAVDPY
jgi:hypothetical protein